MNDRRNPLELALVLLQPAYSQDGAWIWLYARNANLGRRRPIELLAAGEVTTVLAEAERVAGAMG